MIGGTMKRAPFRSGILAAVLVGVGAVGVVVATTGGNTSVDASRGGAQPRQAGRDIAAEASAFRAALRSMPLLTTGNWAPLKPESLPPDYADLFVTGTLVGVEDAGERSLGQMEAACESEEALRTGGTCIRDRLARTVRVHVAADSVRDLRSKIDSGPQDISFEITVGTVPELPLPYEEWPPSKGIESSVEALEATAPVGARVVAYLHRSTVGDFYQLAHVSGWALVADDGSLESLAVEHEPVEGLGDVERAEALPR